MSEEAKKIQELVVDGVEGRAAPQITRYGDYDDSGWMIPMTDGDWVRWEDVKSFIEPNASNERQL